MKKILLFASALAGLFLAASCQQENLEPVRSNTVTITVEAPGALNTKAIADGTNVNEVHYAVYKTNSNEEHAIEVADSEPLAQGCVEMANKRATINFDLLQDQNFTVIFWAQVKGAGHYTLNDLRTIEVNSTVLGNDETRAAFYAKYAFDTYEHKNHTVTLKRPFAQLNLLTTTESLTPVQPGQTNGYEISVEESEVVVLGLSKTFNTVTGLAPAGDDEFTFTTNATPAKQGQKTLTVNGKAYHYVSMNYFFVPQDEKLVDIKYALTTDKGNIKHEIVAVPVKENYRTNVIGNLLTKETKFEIIVDAEFDGDETVEIIAPSTDLAAIIAAAEEGSTIVISGQYGKFPAVNKPLTIICEEGTTFTGNSKLNLNPEAVVIGATFSNPSGNAVDQTITGTFKNCTFTGSNAVRNGYTGTTCYFEDCVFSGAVYGCHFDGKADNELYFKNCTFSGFNAFAAAIPLTTFDGCTFVSNGKSGYNGANLWGSTKMINTEFTFDGSVGQEWIDFIGTDKNYEFTGCTINGGSIFDTKKVWSRNNGTKVTIDGIEYTYVTNGKYYLANGTAVVTNAAAFNKAAEKETSILLAVDIDGDVAVAQKADVNVTVDGNGKKLNGVLVVDGKSATYTTAGLTLKNLTFAANAISADACVRLGDGTNATRYTCNVTVENCTFDVPGAVAVKSYTGGDKNLTIKGCTVTSKAHSLLQAKGIDGILVENCTVNSKNGMNFNNSTNVVVNNCTTDVRGYSVRFGEGASASGAAEVYAISNSTLKSACDDGDAVIILRGTADKATLTITNTTLEGTTKITNNAVDAKVIIDGKELLYNQSELNGALADNKNVTLSDGNYTLPTVNNGSATISGTKDVVITIAKPNCSGSDLTLNGVTVKGSGYATGVQHVNTVTYNDVTVIGEMCLYGEKVVFNNATFELNNQYIWTYGAKEVEFNNCTFNTNGKAILVYNEGAGATKVKVSGCTFNATAGAKAGAIANQNCAAIEIDNFQSAGTGVAHNVTTSNNTYNNNFSGEWRIKNFVAGNAITVNGVAYESIAIDGKLMTIDSNKNVTVQ